MYLYSSLSTKSLVILTGRTIGCIFISLTPRSWPGWGTSRMSTPPATRCCAQVRIRDPCWLTWQLRNTRWAVMSPGCPWSTSRCRSSSCCPKTLYFKATVPGVGRLAVAPWTLAREVFLQSRACRHHSVLMSPASSKSSASSEYLLLGNNY